MNYFTIPGINRFDIIQAVCDEYNITREQLHSKSRKQPLPEARQIVAWYNVKALNQSLNQVKRFLGYGNHSSVIHCVKTVNNRMEVEREFRELVEKILNKS